MDRQAEKWMDSSAALALFSSGVSLSAAKRGKVFAKLQTGKIIDISY